MPTIVCGIVEICVFRRASGKPQYLLLKRSAKDNIYPGIWQIVTGFIEPGEKGMDAGLREVREETGVAPERFWIVPHVNSFYVATEDALHHTICFAAELPAKAKVTLSKEHDSFRWAGYQLAKSKLVWPGQKSALNIVHEYIVGRKEAARLTEYGLLKTGKEYS